jgi:hypothetical protein
VPRPSYRSASGAPRRRPLFCPLQTHGSCNLASLEQACYRTRKRLKLGQPAGIKQQPWETPSYALLIDY